MFSVTYVDTHSTINTVDWCSANVLPDSPVQLDDLAWAPPGAEGDKTSSGLEPGCLPREGDSGLACLE